MIEKLVGMAAIGSSLASAGLLHRFLLAMLNVMILGIILAFTLCILLASAGYTAYLFLVDHGVDPHVIAISLISGTAIIAALLAAIFACQLRKLRGLACPGLDKGKTYRHSLGNIAQAFIDGLLKHKN